MGNNRLFIFTKDTFINYSCYLYLRINGITTI